jgi:hypothetical protein
MECYVHHGQTAVAICRTCGKGVCRDCAIEVPRGVACSENCRPIAESLAQLQLASIQTIGTLQANRYVQPIMALLFIVLGFWLGSDGEQGPFPIFFIAMGFLTGLSWFLGSGRSRS